MMTRVCKNCGVEKEMRRGVWLWSARDGCYGPYCLSCRKIVYKDSQRRASANYRKKTQQAYRESATLTRENDLLRKRIRTLQERMREF